MATVLVIDVSASVRETLRIVLGHEHEVTALSTVADVPCGSKPDVVVLGLPPAPRDEHAIGRTLERQLPATPLLLLHAARDVDLTALVPPRVPMELLPKPFDAYAARARVRSLLAARRDAARPSDPRAGARRWLEVPRLTTTAAAVVRRVLTATLPVVAVQGDPGTGVASVARALHVVGEWGGPFLTLDAARLVGGELAGRIAGHESGPATIYLAALDDALPEVQAEVLELVERVRAGSSSLRVIVAARRELCELAARGEFLPELAYLVTAVPIVLRPLRDRGDELPALVDALTHDIVPQLGLTAVTYRPETLERLRRYLWFGNVAELEAVLTRTLALHRPVTVEPEHLVFLPDQAASAIEAVATARASETSSAATSGRAAAPLAGLDLEVVLGELAHELRNPMVTIKTVAQHLDAILADPDARQRFSTLMAEAVGRMDGLLESLLEFSRFRAPVLRAVDLGTLMDRALDEQRDDLARRQVRIERNGAGSGTVDVDEAQVSFALRSLCRGVVADLVPRSTLTIHRVGAGAFHMQVRTEPSVAARLSAWAAPQGDGETPPLTWALASALLQRNGGTLSVRKDDADTTLIRIEWKETTNCTAETGAGGTEG